MCFSSLPAHLLAQWRLRQMRQSNVSNERGEKLSEDLSFFSRDHIFIHPPA